MFSNVFEWLRAASRRRRSLLLKTVGYRVLSVAVTVAVAFAVLGDRAAALDIGVAANVVKVGVYYAYEAMWDDPELLWNALPTRWFGA